jgi:hypothetical protein
MKIYIGALLMYHSFFLDILADHKIKIKRKRKYNLMISHQLCNYLYKYVFDDFIWDPFTDIPGFVDLKFKIDKFSLDNN